MTPIILLGQIKLFTERCLEDLLLPVKPQTDEAAELRAPQVWKMRLPEGKSEVAKAPYVLLQLLNGMDALVPGEEPDSTCNVRVVVCAYAEDANEGAMHVLNLITRLRTALLKERVIGGMFTLRHPLEYLVYPGDVVLAPFFGGEMMTTWEMPTIKREVPGLWQGELPPERPKLSLT